MEKKKSLRAPLVAQTVKNRLQCRRPQLDPCIRKIPWRRKWQPTPVYSCLGNLRQRSPAGYSPWDQKVWHNVATEWLMKRLFGVTFNVRLNWIWTENTACTVMFFCEFIKINVANYYITNFWKASLDFKINFYSLACYSL